MERYNAEGGTKEGLDYVIAGELKFPETRKSQSDEKLPEWGWKSYTLCSTFNFLSAFSLVYFLGKKLADHDSPYRNAVIDINNGVAAGMLCLGVLHAYYAISSQMEKSTKND